MNPLKSVLSWLQNKFNRLSDETRHLMLAVLIALVMVWAFIPLMMTMTATAWYVAPTIITMVFFGILDLFYLIWAFFEWVDS